MTKDKQHEVPITVTDLLMQLWAVLQKHTGIATDHLAISLREIPPSSAMEMGQIMRPVGQGSGDTNS